MLRRALALALTTAAALAGPAAMASADAAVAKKPKPTGVLKVCSEGAPADVFLDKGKLHREKRNLQPGKCKAWTVPRGQWAVTITADCENFRDPVLKGIEVDPEERALFYPSGSLGGARVKPKTTTTVTATWECPGYSTSSPSPGPGGLGSRR